MATVAALEKAIATNERYASNYRKAGKDPAKYVAKIAALKAELAVLTAPKVAVAEPLPAPATGGPLTQAHIDAMFAHYLDAEDAILKRKGRPYGRDGAARGGLEMVEALAVARSIDGERDMAAMGLFGEPGTVPGVDYSAYTHYVADQNVMRLWINGQKVAEAPVSVSTDVLSWANAEAAKYGVTF